MNLGRTQTAFGGVLPTCCVPHWQGQATARKLAMLIYRTLNEGLVYADPGAEQYDTQHRTHVLRRLRQRARNLGFGFIDLSTGEFVEGGVSRAPNG
jgi:hypothetical protein